MPRMKPCPFCGGTDLDYGFKQTDSKDGENYIVIVWLECCTCGAKTKAVSCVTGSEERAEKAFTKVERAWNRRAEDGK